MDALGLPVPLSFPMWRESFSERCSLVSTAQVSWFRAFLTHERDKYVLVRKTNVVTAVLLAPVLALFITLTIVDRGASHAGRCAPAIINRLVQFLAKTSLAHIHSTAFEVCTFEVCSCVLPMSLSCETAFRRAQWLAVLFGPFGCTLRWLLSKYNYKLPGHWKWLPAGTLAANMIACLVDYAVGVRASLSLPVLAYWHCVSAFYNLSRFWQEEHGTISIDYTTSGVTSLLIVELQLTSRLGLQC